MNIDTQLTDRFVPTYEEARTKYVVFYMDFILKHHHDFQSLHIELENLRRAVTLGLEMGKSPLSSQVVDALACLATFEEATGNYERAREWSKRQIQFCHQSELENEEALLTASSQLVRLATLQGDSDEAQQFLEYQLRILEEVQDARASVDVRLELARLHQANSNLDQADLVCHQGLDISRCIGYQVGTVDMLRQQGVIRFARKHYKDAQNVYQEALNMALWIGDQVRTGEIREQLAALEALMGRYIFISYNHRDRGFVERLAHDLTAAGLAVWWDQWEIKVGDSIIQKVSEGIKKSACLAAVLSPDSVRSNWVQRELGSAVMMQLSAERDVIVLPLLVSDCEVPVLLREIKWADFRKDYQAGLGELLEALEALATPSPANIAETAASFEETTDKHILPSSGELSSVAPSGGSVYITHIEHAEGIAIGNGARVERHELTSSTTQLAPPSVSVSLLTRIVPTAFCHQLDAEAFPLVAVTLDNTGQSCANAALRVSAVIEDYSDVAVASPRVVQGEQARVSLLPALKPAAVATLNEMRPVTLRVTVDQTVPTEHTLYDQTERTHLHARDVALLAIEALDGSIVDLTHYLVAWVTPRRPEIEQLLRQAAEHHPDRRFVGYQGASTLVQGADVVRAQARAIFTTLKQDAGVVYVNSPLNLGKQAGQVTQRVRLPTESLATGSSANCIDGTVLFASLLELASIDPFIVIVPGHAFAGWRIWQGVSQYEFLETTMIGSDDFDAAQQSAQTQYDDVLMRGYFSRGLFDPGGFARLIDVASCRAKGILPLE